MTLWKDFIRGIWRENPSFRMLIGMCPVLAVTSMAINGLAMGLSVTFVLVCSSIMISLVRDLIPSKVRIPCYIVIIATFVTIIDLVLAALFPDIHKVLGIFIPLIVVNCIILGRAEAFASKNPVINS
ncbi:MAG TPA: electron transport complex subunit RsxE, partial [Thermoanaerobacterales bacterium]|nr:electron transport complex subunit RsxE [Thermoanaerobacterales bacterium]